MLCQRCGQAEAEWRVREFRGANRSDIFRWWYLCDLCVMEDLGPWLPKRGIPPMEDGEMFSTASKLVYRREGDKFVASRRIA